MQIYDQNCNISQPLTIDQALTKVGASNYYQYRAFVFFGLQWLFANWILISPIYIFKTPNVECGMIEECNSMCRTLDSFGSDNGCYDYICQQSYEIRSQILKGQSLILAFDSQLICDRQKTADLLKSMPYSGSLIGFFIFSFIADNYGRKLGIGLSWFCATIGAIILSFSFNFEMIGVGLFMSGFGINPAITIQYSLFNEHTWNFRDIQNIGVQVFFGVGEILIVFIAYYFRNWRDLTLYWFAVPLLIMNFGMLLIYESPKYEFIIIVRFYYSRDKQKTIKVLNQIAEVNKKQKIKINELQECANNIDRVHSMIDLVRLKSLRGTFMCGIIMFFALQVIYYGINFAMENIGLNLYYNAFIVASFETFSFIIADNYIVRLPRKKIIFIGLLLSCILSFLFVFLKPPSDCGSVCLITIFQIIMAGLIRFVVCFVMGFTYTYIPELFPTPLRSQAMSLISAAGTVGSIICPFLISYSKKLGIQPLISLGLVGLTGVLAVLPLRETLNQPMLEHIEEYKTESTNLLDSKKSEET